MATAFDPSGFNPNPVSNPTHPAHQLVARHMGRVLGHILTGNGEAAAHHLGQAIGHALAPHMVDKDPAAVGAAVTDNIKQAAHGSKKPAAGKRAKKP